MPTGKKKAGEKKAPASKPAGVKLSNVKLTVDAFQARAQRTVNTIYGPRVAMPGEWILDLTEGHYAIATDEQVQRLLKK